MMVDVLSSPITFFVLGTNESTLSHYRHYVLVMLPSVSYDLETEEIKVDPNERKKLLTHGLPVATSFAVYDFSQR